MSACVLTLLCALPRIYSRMLEDQMKSRYRWYEAVQKLLKDLLNNSNLGMVEHERELCPHYDSRASCTLEVTDQSEFLVSEKPLIQIQSIC